MDFLDIRECLHCIMDAKNNKIDLNYIKKSQRKKD